MMMRVMNNNENHYVNCGEKDYTKVDHRSYRRNFCSFFSGFLFATVVLSF